ncbi:MAG: hypothetical protein CFE32_25215, partial [Alphaproteobacteria bacterium PA3]
MTTDQNSQNKKDVLTALTAVAESTPTTLRANLSKIYHPDAHWRGSHPWNEMNGLQAIETGMWSPLLHAFPDLERRDNLVIGGQYEGRDYVGMVGHLVGTFKREWSGIAPSDKVIYLRYGE